MQLPVQTSPFHAAVVAFEIRFERELADRWQALESEAALAAVHAPPEKKRSILYGFFQNAEKEIGNVVHEYFPRLLQVAATQRQHLGNESPLAWTHAQVLRQVCDFLGVDEKFNHACPPREDSLLVLAAARIALSVDLLDEATPADFVLPCWVESRWALSSLVGRALCPGTEDDAESLPPLSRAETLEWIKGREFWISKKIERQIDNDSWDGMVEAGKSDVSILDAAIAGDEQPAGRQSTGTTKPNENSFIRDATTWNISFGEETCRVKTMIGLEYMAVLLKNPGEAVSALELQTRASGRSLGLRTFP
jgi:hypothetical protein